MILGKYNRKLNWIFPVLLAPFMLTVCLWFAQRYTIGALLAIVTAIVITSYLISRFQWHYHLLMVLAILLPFSVEVSLADNLEINIPSEPLLIIIIFSIVWDILRKPGLFKQLLGKETLWILPFLLSFVITSFFSTIVWVSLKTTLVNSTYIMVFFIWQKYLFKASPDMFPKLMRLYSFSLLAVLIFSLFQFKSYEWNPITIRGIFKPFYKDNTILGAATALVATFWIAYTKVEKTLTSRMLWLFSGLLFIAVVVLSTSRAAALSLIAFGVVWLMLHFRVRLKHITLVIISVFALIGIFQSSFYQLLQENKHMSHDDQGDYVEQLQSSGNISSDISNIERLNRWIAGLRMFAEKPYTGFGPGTYQFAYIPYQKEEFKSRLTVKDPWHIPENSGGTAHSEYFLAASEMGLLGILTLLILFGRWIWIAFEKSRLHYQRATIVIAFAVLSTYLFHALFNNFLTTDKFAFLFWGTGAWMAAHFEMKETVIL